MSEGIFMGKFLGNAYNPAKKGKIEIDFDKPISKTEARIRGAAQEITMGWSDEIEAALYTLADPSVSYTDYRAATRTLDKIAREQQGDAYEEGEYGAMIATAIPALASGAGAVKFIPKLAKVMASKVGIKGTVKGGLEISKKALKPGRMSKANRTLSDEARKIIKRESKGKPDVVGKRRLIEEADQLAKRGKDLKEIGELGQNLKDTVKIGAAQGAVYGLGKNEKENIYEEIGSTLKGATGGALMSAVFPVGKMLLKKGSQLNTGMKNFISGLSQEQIKWLQKHPELFLKRDTYEGFKDRLFKRFESLQKVSNKASKDASKVLDRARTIPKEEVIKPIDDIIESEKERLLKGGKATGETKEYFEELQSIKDELLEQFEESDFISEASLNAIRRGKVAPASKYSNPHDPNYKEQVASSVRQIAYQWDRVVGKSNPEYDRLMEPARRIEAVMGDNKRRGLIGVRSYFNVVSQPNSARYTAVQGKGADTTDRQIVNVLSAPFRDRGMEKFKTGRNLIDEVENLHKQYVSKSKKSENLLKRGEAIALGDITEKANPRTGYSTLAADPTEEVAKPLLKKVPMGEAISKFLGAAVATVRTEKGKEIMADIIARKAMAPKKAPGKVGVLAERLSDPTALPRYLTTEIVGREGESAEESKKKLRRVLMDIRKKAQPGEDYGIKTPFSPGFFEGVKEKEDIQIPLDPEKNQNTSMLDDIKQKEDEEMEKKKLSFLSQQSGNKARYK